VLLFWVTEIIPHFVGAHIGLLVNVTVSRDSLLPGFPREITTYIDFKFYGSMYRKIRFLTPNILLFFWLSYLTCRISDNAKEYFDCPTVGENVYRCRTAINRPLIGRNRRR